MNPTEAAEAYAEAHTPRADRVTSMVGESRSRLSDYQRQLDEIRGRATASAQALNDVGLMRATLERVVEIVAKLAPDAISIAIAYGQVRESLYDYAEAVQVVKKADELRRQIEKLKPRTETKVD